MQKKEKKKQMVLHLEALQQRLLNSNVIKHQQLQQKLQETPLWLIVPKNVLKCKL